MKKNKKIVSCILFICILTIVASMHPCYADANNSKNSSGTKNIDPKLTSEAVEYHQQLTILFPELKIAKYNYIKAATKTRKVRSIEKNRQSLIKVIQKNLAHVQTSPVLHNDSTLKTEIIRYLDMLYVVMKEDFDKILDMEDIEAQSYDQDEAHQLALDLAFAKLDSCRIFLTKTDDAFFAAYNIKVDRTKDKISEKIDHANNAINYYDPIYRVFYKANKQYSYTHSSLGKKDMAALQQHTATLSAFSEEGFEKLKDTKGYEGDDELLKTVREILKFYKNEGAVTMPANIDFFFKVEAFQNALKKFESIKPDARTQKDVDEYNKSVNTYNASAKEINQLNDASYKKHKDFINKWNKSVDNFFELHS